MADTSNLTNYLTDVADSIREKTHSNELIPASKFDEKILSIATDTTANPTEILNGKTAYIDGDKVTGTYPIQYKKLDDITSDNTTLDTPIEANMKLLPVGNTTQEVISAVAGTTVSGTDITISDYDDTKESRFTKFEGDTTQATSILPTEYQQVEYIESTGTQYIDTGYVPQGNSEIQADIQINRGVSELTNVKIFGTVDTNKSLAINFGDAENSYQNIFVWNGRGYNSGETVLQIYLNLDFINQRHKYILNNNGLKIDNTLHEKQGVAIASVYSITLFTFNRDSGVNQNCGKYKLYTCKIYEGQTLVRDFIPCYRKSDNEIGLYDLVNNVFYTNQGDGTFLKGSNISIPNLDYPQEIQVVKGSNNVKIFNKNTLNISNFTKTQGGVTLKVENNHITITGTGTATTFYLASYTNLNEINANFLNKQVTFSVKNLINSGSISFAPQSIWLGSSSNNYYLQPDSSGVVTKKITQKLTLLALYILGGTYDTSFDLQFEEGSTSTSYVAHQEQNYTITLPTGMELCKIGNNQDYIYKNIVDGNWYKHSEIGKFGMNTLANLFDNITYFQSNFNSNNGIISLRLSNNLFSNLNIKNVSFKNYYNEKLKSQEGGWNSVNSKNRFSNIDGLTIWLHYTDLGLAGWTTETIPNLANKLTTCLGDTNFYLPLRTPTDTQITDTTLIGQLEAIEEATGYAGTTYIITTNSNNLAIIPSYKYNFITPAPSPERESNIQVVKGSNNIKIENKNILNFEDETIAIAGSYVNFTSSPSVTFNSNFRYYGTQSNILWSRKLKAGTYSYNNMIVAGITGLRIFNADTSSSITTSNSGTFTLNNDTNIQIKMYTYNDEIANKTIYPQLEVGSMTTPYIEHREQNYPITLPEGMELCKIGGYQDYIYKNGDNWYKKAYIGKLVLEGQGFAGYASGNSIIMYPNYENMFNQNLITGAFIKGICNREVVQRSAFVAPEGTLYISDDGTIMVITNSNLTTKEGWQQYFQENPHIIYGILSTPTETKITDTTLVNQLNAIYNNAKTYYDKTNIIITAAENNATIQLKVKIPTQGIDTSEVTATSDDIILGKTAVINNQVVTGTSVAVVVSDTTALASDVAYGKVFYLADGTKAVGTYVQEDLNTELTALEGQVTTLQTALDGKSSSQINQQEYEEAVNQVEDLLGDSNE